MSNTPNQIPEEVLKGMQEDAERLYPYNPIKEGMTIASKAINESFSDLKRSAYLQGRQDEWERQREEVKQKDKTIERQLNQQKFMASEIERLKVLLQIQYKLACYTPSHLKTLEEIAVHDERSWQNFKTKHNL